MNVLYFQRGYRDFTRTLRTQYENANRMNMHANSLGRLVGSITIHDYRPLVVKRQAQRCNRRITNHRISPTNLHSILKNYKCFLRRLFFLSNKLI